VPSQLTFKKVLDEVGMKTDIADLMKRGIGNLAKLQHDKSNPDPQSSAKIIKNMAFVDTFCRVLQISVIRCGFRNIK